MSIEGIPDGWELVRVGKVKPGEVRVAADGTPAEWSSVESDSANYVILLPDRAIRKPASCQRQRLSKLLAVCELSLFSNSVSTVHARRTKLLSLLRIHITQSRFASVLASARS